VADRLGLRGTIIVCFLISFCAIALLGYSNGLVMLTILATLSGAGNSTAMNLAHTYVSTYYPQSMRSTAMGFAFGLGRFGGILGPLMAGVLLSFKADLSVIFIILGSTGVVCSVLISLVQKMHSFWYLSRQAASEQAELTRA
jgi:AAHS family benzoate transporter-like MFS transporter